VAGSNAVVAVVGFYTKAIDELRSKLQRAGLAVGQLQQMLKQAQLPEGSHVVSDDLYVRMAHNAIELEKLTPIVEALDAYCGTLKLEAPPETANDVRLATLYDRWMAYRTNRNVDAAAGATRRGTVRATEDRSGDADAGASKLRGKVSPRKRER
jgi:hypothetical protein